jgi:murein L,D-transpeptidase YafK
MLVTSAALAASVVLTGCDSDSFYGGAKANKPISEKLLAEIESKNMDKGSPVLVRLFKQEAELEVWKQDRTGHFALLKTYPICRWSGDLGPKVREGDRQAPEGFYSISPTQMNPQSAYYLSFNTGFPNAYDKAWGRSGSHLMVHGDCSSRGCYAMTDEQISEIYALGRESFFGGQSAFQFQAYPFRMTAENMARHRDNPNMAFWRMLKEGNDLFEVTKLEPKVDFCEKKYVFGAEKPEGQTRPLVFNASAKCPAYTMAPDVAEALREKQNKDNSKLAELIARGTPTARSRAGIDGGMHPIFASKLPDSQSIALDKDVSDYTIASYLPAPGTIPGTVNPPTLPEATTGEAAVAATSSSSSSAAQPQAAVISSSREGFLAKLSRTVGLKKDEPQDAPAPAMAPPKPQPARPVVQVAKSKDAAKSVVAKSSDTDSKVAEAKAAAARVIPLDNKSKSASAFPDPAVPVQPATQQQPQSMAGAQQPVPANGFDSRWTSFH